MDAAGDAVTFESAEPLVLTKLGGVLSSVMDPDPDFDDSVGETS